LRYDLLSPSGPIQRAAESREDLKSDPAKDAILSIFYCLLRESDEPAMTGFIAVRDVLMPDQDSAKRKRQMPKLAVHADEIEFVDSELEVINTFVDKFHEWDPEVLCGFEVQFSSWGYLLERAHRHYGALSARAIFRCLVL
jgi:DNA polymerase zeta